VPDLHLLLPPIWFCHQKFKAIAWTSLSCRFLILLLPLSCCCNAAAETLLLQRGCCSAAAATRMLQRCMLLLQRLLDPD